MIAALAATLLATAGPAIAPHRAPASIVATAAMEDARFWEIIERSAAGGASQEQQQANLRRILAALPLEDVEAYQAAFDAKRAAAYSWDLWGADFVIHGGASDDAFDYFRNWLISRGRAAYEAALANPDSLAALIPEDAAEPLEFEEFGRVGAVLWSERTGRSVAEMPLATTQPARPFGKPWREDEAALARRYPRLWKRFGQEPLG